MKISNRISCLLLVSALLLAMAPTGLSQSAQLRVAQNQRFFEFENGKPFFYLADTAWELFHRLNREEAELYLDNRAEKGFTVIQAVALAQLGGLTDPNPYGHLPLEDRDPARPKLKEGPQNDYWDHVDFIVNQAAARNLQVGLLPTWGSYWQQRPGSPSVFNPDNAYQYGRFLGERYGNQPVIWILGGDENVRNATEIRIIEAMAKGLKAGDGGRNLITYHPRGPGLSSDFFHHSDWLDFNMFQSSHGGRNHDNGLFAAHDHRLEPVKPTLDGEPRYELIQVGFYNSTSAKHLRFDDDDTRQAAYWSLFSGACGHAYGHNSVWQMWSPDRAPVIDAKIPWHQALNHPGAFQMSHVRKLFESRPYQRLRPDSSLIVDGPDRMPEKVKALLDLEKSFAFVYSPFGRPFSVKMSSIQADKVRSSWFDPRYGIGDTFHTTDTLGIQTFTPPTEGKGCDWILVLEDADSFPPE